MPDQVIKVRNLPGFVASITAVTRQQAARKALESGMEGISRVLANSVRRGLRAAGLGSDSLLVQSIDTETKTNPKTGVITAKAGARNRTINGKNPADYFHIYDQGAKPHFQPNAYRPVAGVNGRSVLMKVPGGADHPGFEGRNVMEPALANAEQEVVRKFDRGFDQRFNQEISKLQKV